LKIIQADLIISYPFRESIGWFWRNIFAVRKTNLCGIRPLPQQTFLNPVHARTTVGFVGDIMSMGRKALRISPSMRDFFRNCDFLVGNFEGTITKARKAGLADQAHDASILDALADLFPPERTFLSVANNHAGDFPEDVLRQSIDRMRKRGFHVFGLREEPFADISCQVRIVGASMWSNRPCGAIASFDLLDKCCRPNAFNIAYPHWGYEMELFPRPDIVRAGEQLLRTYDAVLGHHSHCPQPLTSLNSGPVKKLLAFSLGDFCVGLRIRKFQYGIACRVEIGPGDDGVWRIGAVASRYTKVSPAGPDSMKIDLALVLAL
jgi:hypothetical protein